MCYEGFSIALRKKTYPSQVNLLEFPGGVTGHVKREIQHIWPIQLSKTPSVLLLFKTFQGTDHQCPKEWQKDGKKRAGFKQSFHCEERHFPSLWTGMALKMFNIVIINLIKVL